MRSLLGSRLTAVLLAVGLLTLASCGDDDAADAAGTSSSTTTTAAADDHPDGDSADQVASPVRRLAVADAADARLVLIDLDEDAAVSELDLPAPASHASSVTEDGRLLLLAHDEAVTVVDGGAWSDGHGDHSHHFVDEPSVVGTVDGDRPTHLISHDGTAALWFDGLGEAVLLDEHDLADGELVEVGRVPTPAPHHGFAIPHGDHVVLTAPPPAGEEMPDTVAVADHSGAVESEHPCRQTHGEASWSSGAAAACADGVLILRVEDGGWTPELLAYPEVDDTDAYGYGNARAWVLEAVGDGSQLVAPFGEHHVLLVDLATGHVLAMDMGVPVEIFGVTVHEPSGHLIVLTGDGAVLLLAPDTGDVVDRADVLAPAGERGADDPYRMLVVSGNDVFVSDPAGRAVVHLEVYGDALAAVRTHDLDFTPSFVGIVNG